MADKLALGAVAVAIVVTSSLVTWTKAKAHEAPQGWSYSANCCSNRDCREIKSSDIGEMTTGYLIKISAMKEVIPYGSPKIKESPDGRFHWCSYSGRDDGRTICLYVPPRGY